VSDVHALPILVVDDEPLILSVMQRMLVRMGFSAVETFERGELALARLEEDSAAPGLILLDLNMPGLDGVEFIRGLVDRAYRGHLIIVSGENERVLQSVQHLVRAHGIAELGHLVKPVRPEALEAVLTKWGAKEREDRRPGKAPYAAEVVRTAIEQGQLTNFYQPKVSLATGEFVGVEALVRWQHPTDGMVFPDQFIGVAESNGLIDALTRAVVKNAISQTRAWNRDGIVRRMAVNVSMDNLASLDFAEFVRSATSAENVMPASIQLEVTESRLMQDLRGPLETLTRLRLHRFGLSIDDFGTGHSSLAQLRDIPFDELKIDRSFVHGVARNETVRAIYSASLSLAKQLHMQIVAEGVEDREDWEFLRGTGCDYAQGYFIGRPMPASGLPEWHDKWRARWAGELQAPVKVVE
jgi:EAL domain-containing protein (putative c-di-GMP-specific phosphodiesterase class I)/DNA-binding NarL/FixJ family response regulator